MPRLRCTREQAEAEAIRLAKEFVLTIPKTSDYRFRGARPDTSLPRTNSGKIPAVWCIAFQWQPPDGSTVDGCELFIRVNVQTKVAELHPLSV
jgi:hypothetical protein